MQSFLDLSKIGEVREDERIIQVDDGTIFYWQYSPPHRLFVRIHDRRIDAALPSEEIRCSGSYGNSVYFASNGKIFKANFSPSQGIIVAYFRDEIQNEVGRWGFNSIARGSEKYVTRLCDDPNNHSSFVNVTNEECKGWQVRRIHRDNVILSSGNAEAVWPSARKVRENIILVETCNQYALFVRDDSSLLYLTDGRNMFTLNTTSMKFLPTLKFRDAHISYVVGVHAGVLTCMGMKDSEYCLMAGPLPQGYYEHSILEDSDQNDADTLTDRSRSKKQEEAELRNALKDRDEQIASLQSEITKLKVELNQQSERNSELLKDNMRIPELEKENSQLKNEIIELRLEIADLTEEEEDIGEVSDTVTDLMAVIARLTQESVTVKVDREMIEPAISSEPPEPAELALSPVPIDPESDKRQHFKSPESSL